MGLARRVKIIEKLNNKTPFKQGYTNVAKAQDAVSPRRPSNSHFEKISL